jgi:hypothetical protein
VPTTFTFQPIPVLHRQLTPQQQADYEIQSATHGEGTDTPAKFLGRYAFRIRFYRFFFLAPLYLALPFFAMRLRHWRYVWVVLTVALFTIGANFYPYYYTHYIAALTCLFVLISIAGLERLTRVTLRGQPAGAEAARLIVLLCFGHFLFWYGLHLFGPPAVTDSLIRYETWDAINHGDPEGRLAVADALAKAPGQHLVFVRYWPGHTFKEWVHNGADVDGSRVVWARDIDAGENEKLIRYFPHRTVWLLQPDARPPRLEPYTEH